MFYVLCEADTPADSFMITDDDSHVKPFDTEEAAVAAAKEYSGHQIILKPVARVTEKTTHKVEKLK